MGERREKFWTRLDSMCSSCHSSSTDPEVQNLRTLDSTKHACQFTCPSQGVFPGALGPSMEVSKFGITWRHSLPTLSAGEQTKDLMISEPKAVLSFEKFSLQFTNGEDDSHRWLPALGNWQADTKPVAAGTAGERCQEVEVSCPLTSKSKSGWVKIVRLGKRRISQCLAEEGGQATRGREPQGTGTQSCLTP